MPEERTQLCGPEPDSDGFRRVAAAVVAEVLETMFFAAAAPSECCHNWLSCALAVRVPFEGSHSGEMQLGTSLEAADSITCAFLGADLAEVNQTSRDEVILELANVLCGATLSHLWPESKLALSVPEAVPAEQLPNEPFPGDQSTAGQLHGCFELAEGRLAVWIRWQEGAGAA
jgi:CheY-specific phosphatase CheX